MKTFQMKHKIRFTILSSSDCLQELGRKLIASLILEHTIQMRRLLALLSTREL